MNGTIFNKIENFYIPHKQSNKWINVQIILIKRFMGQKKLLEKRRRESHFCKLLPG